MKRTFTLDELEELGLPNDSDDHVVHREMVEQKRWGNEWHLVFRTIEEDGVLWRVSYFEPATEEQEIGPWGYGFEPDSVGAVQVEPYQVEVTKYRPVAA